MALGKLKSSIGHVSRKNITETCHVALKLTGLKRWKSVKESTSLKEGIVINFSGNHDSYYPTHRYICKDDDSAHHSKHHPNLDDAALHLTKKSTQAYRKARKPYTQENPTNAPQKKEAESNIQ